MRLAVLMAVGPGEADRHLARTLASAGEWADRLIIYGDGVDGATAALLTRTGCCLHLCRENVHAQGEQVVRNRLLDLADSWLNEGDMVVVLDADETVHHDPGTIRWQLQSLADAPEEAWAVHFLHAWTPDGTMHRVDGMWQPSTGTRIYRHRQGLRVASLGAWVCPAVPLELTADPNPVLTVLHWGYALPEDRPRKHQRYAELAGHHPRHVASIVQAPTLAPVPTP